MRYSVERQREEQQIRILDAWWPRTRRHIRDLQHLILVRPKMADAIIRQTAALLRVARKEDRRREFLAALAARTRRARVAKAALTIVRKRGTGA